MQTTEITKLYQVRACLLAVVLADLVMSGFEGALILSRAARSPEPFWRTVDALVNAVDHDTAVRRPPSRPQRRSPRAARTKGPR